jgi:hypothetical protein
VTFQTGSKIGLDRIPPEVHTFVAAQLGLLWDHSKHYAWNSRTRGAMRGLRLLVPRSTAACSFGESPQETAN